MIKTVDSIGPVHIIIVTRANIFFLKDETVEVRAKMRIKLAR